MIESRAETTIQSCSVCENIASWEPMIYAWPNGGKTLTRPTMFIIDMPLCENHRSRVTDADLLCEGIWSAILEWAFKNNKPIPDRMSAEIRYRRLNEEVMVH